MDKELIKDITKDIWKYILIGGLGFAISSIYQAWILEPENNITIFPLSVSLDKSSEGKTFCMVNAPAATEFLKTIPQDSDMAKYISVLRQYTSPVDIGTLDARELKSKAPKFFDCHNANLRPVSRSAFSAALIMKEPTTYLLDKKCHILYLDNGVKTEIPALISVQEKGSPYVFNNTGVLSIGYDPEDPTAKDSVDMKNIDEVERQLAKGNSRENAIGINCQIAQKRAWHKFWKQDNYNEIKSDLEKIRISIK